MPAFSQSQWEFIVTDNNKRFWTASPDNKAFTLTHRAYNNESDTLYCAVSLWNTLENNKINLTRDFIIKFRAYFGEVNNRGADGIVFNMFQRADSLPKLDSTGGCLDYTNPLHGSEAKKSKFKPCFSIEFDTYKNDELFGDSAYDHIQYVKDGQMEKSGRYNTPVPAKFLVDGLTPKNIEDSVWHCIAITWKAETKTLSTYFDGVLRHSFSFSTYTDLINPIDTLQPVNWVITAATGQCTNDQKIIFDYINTYTVPDTNMLSECVCNCLDKNLNGFLILKPVSNEEPNPTNCCYDLILENKLNCPWGIKDLTGIILKPIVGYGYQPIDHYDGFSFEEKTEWQRTQLDQYTLKWSHAPDILYYGDTLEVARICISKDGMSYRFDFWDHSAGLDSSENIVCKYTQYAKCDYNPNVNCCNNITVEAEADGANPNNCCYYLYIKDTLECVPSFFNSFDLDENGNIFRIRAEHIDYSLGTPGDPKGLRFGPYCMMIDGRDSILTDIYFVHDVDTTVCQKKVHYKCPVEACCDSISVTITTAGQWDSGTLCCFQFDIVTDSTVFCDSLYASVWENGIGGKKLWPQNGDSIIDGSRRLNFCLSYKNFFGEQKLPVRIDFRNKIGLLICSKIDTLTKCNGLQDACTPDSMSFSWETPRKGSFNLYCGSQPGNFCKVGYTYTYRHIKDGGGNSIHRDIQVLQWNINCDCPDSNIIKYMLENIWDDPSVINKFQLHPEDPNWKPDSIDVSQTSG